MLAYPMIYCNTLGFMPALANRVQKVCLRIWGVMFGKGVDGRYFGIGESHADKVSVGVVNLEARTCIRYGIACFRIIVFVLDFT